MKVTIIIATLCAVATVTMAGSRRSEALSAAELYPYCAVYASGADRNCYIRSRSECDFQLHAFCIDNPAYIGAARAKEWKRQNKPEWRWW